MKTYVVDIKTCFESFDKKVCTALRIKNVYGFNKKIPTYNKIKNSKICKRYIFH